MNRRSATVAPALFRVVGLAVLVGLAGLALAQPQKGRGGGLRGGEGAGLWKKLLDARANHRYIGVRQVTTGQGAKAKSYLEKVTVQGQRSRTEFPGEGPYKGMIVVDTPQMRLTYMPERNEIRRSEPVPVEIQLGFAARGQGQNLTSRPGGRVAGFETTLVEVTDRRGIVSQKVWIDENKGVILRREVLNAKGERILGFEFLQIQHGVEIPASAFQINVAGAKTVTPMEELQRQSRSAGLPSYVLPPETGFKLTIVRTINRDGVSLIRQFYSGSNKVSLIVSRSEIPAAMLRETARGRVSVHAWRQDGLFMVLIGDLSPEDLKVLAGKVQVWQPRKR